VAKNATRFNSGKEYKKEKARVGNKNDVFVLKMVKYDNLACRK
jgi:hypothetical protein